MRLDRLLSIQIDRQLSRLTARRTLPAVPILMYHGINRQLSASRPYYETNTTPEIFARHMKFLGDNGYSAVSIEESLQCLLEQKPFVNRVVITFDDGFRDFHSTAYPILRQWGFASTVFLPTGLIDDQRLQWQGADLMTWAEIRELQALGVRFGSHTVSHPDLDSLDEKRIAWELGESKQTIEDKVGVSIKSFAYPYAFPEHNPVFTKRLGQILEEHGYDNGVSTVIGRARRCDNRFFLPRLPVNRWDDLRLFEAKLHGGYDWLHTPQHVYKIFKSYVKSTQRAKYESRPPKSPAL